jgi:hypothetical protein
VVSGAGDGGPDRLAAPDPVRSQRSHRPVDGCGGRVPRRFSIPDRIRATDPGFARLHGRGADTSAVTGDYGSVYGQAGHRPRRPQARTNDGQCAVSLIDGCVLPHVSGGQPRHDGRAVKSVGSADVGRACCTSRFRAILIERRPALTGLAPSSTNPVVTSGPLRRHILRSSVLPFRILALLVFAALILTRCPATLER